MSSSETVFEAPSLYIQNANEQAAHVKKNVFPICVDLGHIKSVISLIAQWFSTTGVSRMKIKRLCEYKDDFLVFL